MDIERPKEDSMKVKDVMHRGVTWVEPGTSIRDIAQMMRDDDIGSVPVGENDRLVGIVTDRDIICRGIADGADFSRLDARRRHVEADHLLPRRRRARIRASASWRRTRSGACP